MLLFEATDFYLHRVVLMKRCTSYREKKSKIHLENRVKTLKTKLNGVLYVSFVCGVFTNACEVWCAHAFHVIYQCTSFGDSVANWNNHYENCVSAWGVLCAKFAHQFRAQLNKCAKAYACCECKTLSNNRILSISMHSSKNAKEKNIAIKTSPHEPNTWSCLLASLSFTFISFENWIFVCCFYLVARFLFEQPKNFTF